MQALTRQDAPIIAQDIQSNPEKLRWLVMTLLSCPGSLVDRREGLTLCLLCKVPVNDIFSHLLAFCTKMQSFTRQKQNILNIADSLQSDPESAASTLIYWLFMSSKRFCMQRDFAELLMSVRSFPVCVDL